MASFNVSLEDSSPLISYSPAEAWTDSPENDPLVQSYSASSLHATSAQGATATITFNGTGIWFFGGRRPEYGSYTLSIDGQTTSNGDANAAVPVFDQLLAGASNLGAGMHTAVLTNTGSESGLDLDSVVFETAIGSSGQSISNQTIDDAQPQITFSSDWKANTGAEYMQNTLHFTQNGGATASMTFSGEAVAIYGTVSPDHSDFSVAIDGKTTTSGAGGGGLARVLHAQTLLYFASGLGHGQHNLLLTANPELAGQQNTGAFMDVDAMRVYSATGGSNSNNAKANPSDSKSSSNNGSSSRHGLSSESIGIIAGAVAGALVLLGAVALILSFLVRRRIRRKRSRMPLQSPRSPDLPMQRPEMTEPGVRRSDSVGRSFPAPVYNPRPAGYGAISGQAARTSRDSDAGSIRSIQSYDSSSRLILDPAPKGRIPRPPPTVARSGGPAPPPWSDYQEGQPIRPFRPPDLHLSPVPL